MTDILKNKAPEIFSEIQKANNILMHCHPSPDPDSIGSTLGLYHSLKHLNKNIHIISGDSPIPTSVSSLPGIDQIISKNWTQININDYDLFIILDSSSPGQITDKVKIEFPLPIKSVVIDHHKSNSSFADINLVDFSYPATCQMVADLLDMWNVTITPESATCLLLGMYTDTGGFVYPPTDSSTFETAAKLSKVCPNYYEYVFEYENSLSAGKVKFIGLALSNIHEYFSGKVAVSEVTYEMLEKNGLSPADTEKTEVSNMLISAVEWMIGINMKEKTPNYVEFSMRTRNPQKYPVGNLAVAMGGGGHPAAAGARLNLSFPAAKEKLLKCISDLYPELGAA